MTPFMLTGDLVPPEVIKDFETAKEFLALLPDPTGTLAPATAHPHGDDTRYLWSCHGIARALATVLTQPWEVIDGWFLRRGNEHGWLYLEVDNDQRSQFILDVYPVAAVGGPLLLDVRSYGSPWPDAYIERRMAFPRNARQRFDEEGRQALRLYKLMTGTSEEVQSLDDWLALVSRGEAPAGPVPQPICDRFRADFAAGIGPEIDQLRRDQVGAGAAAAGVVVR